MNSTAKARSNTGDMFSDRLYAMLRIDKKLGIISGDLHTDIKRKDWHLSFESQAIFTLDKPANRTAEEWAENGWHLIAVCQVHTAGQTGRSQTVVTIALRHDAQNGLGAVRIHHAAPNGAVILDLSRTDETRWEKDTFRYLKPIHLIDCAGHNDPYHKAIVEAAIGTEEDNIGEAFNCAGTKIFWKLKETPKTDTQDPTLPPPSSPYEIINAGLGTPFELISAYQWSDDPYQYAILFSSADEKKFGTVLELDNEVAPLTKVRFGAIIFLKPIIKRAKEFQPNGDAAAQFADIIKLVRQTYIHEVGHLMNLAHTWQRSWFTTPAMRGNPTDKSVMSYGSRFPLGSFMTASRYRQASGKKNEIRKLEKRDANLALAHGLRDLEFTDDEARWLRHAPFDQVAPGGPYFTSRGGSELKLGPETAKNTFDLSLTLWDTEIETKNGTQTDGAQPDVHLLSNFTKSPFNRQALFGEVVLKVRRETAKDFPFHFAFQAPTLSLLLRVEVQDKTDDDHRSRVVKEINAPQLPTDWVINRGGKKETIDLARNFHETAVSPINPFPLRCASELTFRRRLPFVHIDTFINTNFTKFLDPITLDGADLLKFTVQVVLRPAGDMVDIYSEPIPIRFVDNGKMYSQAEVDILNHPELPRFVEAMAYLKSGYNIAELEAIDKHDPHASAPVFAELAAMIRTLPDRGTLSPELFNYLFMLEATRELENKNRLRSPAFEITRALRPVVRQHLQEEPEILRTVLNRFTDIR